MQMSKFKTALATALLFLLFLAMSGQFGKNQQVSSLPQGALPGQEVQAQTTPQELWRMDTFQNKEDTSLPYDQGLFTNTVTGEQLWAQCLDPTATDPSPGDTFTKSGDYFSPTSGQGQSFQAFQVITITPTLMAQPTATVPAQGILPDVTNTPNGSGVPVRNFLPICGIVALGILLVILFLRIRNR